MGTQRERATTTCDGCSHLDPCFTMLTKFKELLIC